MGKVRVLKRQDGSFIELPAELSDTGELELFKLKEGFYLLSKPLGGPAPEERNGDDEEGELSGEERLVLKKLLGIRFENRTPEQVSGSFSPSEMEVLRGLEERRFVNVFKGSKYRYGVYNINDHAYSLLRKGEREGRVPRPQTQNTGPSTHRPHQGRISDTHRNLMKQGFMIIKDKEEARMLSEVLGKDMRQGLIFGVKGFDGKFYIVTRDYMVRGQNSINLILTEDMEARAIAQAAKLEPEGCTAILNLMADRGEVIEKRKGVFAPA